MSAVRDPRVASLLACFVTCLLAARAGAAEVRSANAAFTVEKAGCGFIDGIVFAGREVVKARDGFPGAAVSLARAGDPAAEGEGAADSLFPNEVALTLKVEVESLRTGAGCVNISGRYAGGNVRVPFTRRIEFVRGGDIVKVTEETDFRGLDARYVVAAHALELPLVMDDDPHLRMLGFGGARRAELFRMDMNDVTRAGKQLISAARGHRPYWDLGGVLQLPAAGPLASGSAGARLRAGPEGSYRIWRANHADTMAYPIEEGKGAPGWADYSELDWGVTVTVLDPARSAPWAVEIDAREGVVSVAPYPASRMPASGRDLGVRSFGFELALHETSWPAAHPCELDKDLYRALLARVAKFGEHVLHTPLGTADIDTIIRRERVQPSAVLRTLYRGDAWRMQGLMKEIGRSVPRNQPFEKWERDAGEYLAHIRRNGVPQ